MRKFYFHLTMAFRFYSRSVSATRSTKRTTDSLVSQLVILLRGILMGKHTFYAVKRGRQAGVYRSWDECRRQTEGFSSAVFKGFSNEAEAWNFVNTSSTSEDPPSGKNIDRTRNYETSTDNGIKKGRIAKNYRRQALKTSFDRKAVSVYTDGACESNGRNGAKAGIGVYWGPGHELNVSKPLEGRQTNNRAEIQAAITAIKQAKDCGLTSINLHTDSQFLINGVTTWMQKWKANDWKLSSGDPVKNKEDFEALDSVQNGIEVNWVYVRGHSGNDGNEAADKLARDGIFSRK